MLGMLALPITVDVMKFMDESGKETFTKQEVTSFIFDAFASLQEAKKIHSESKDADEFVQKMKAKEELRKSNSKPIKQQESENLDKDEIDKLMGLGEGEFAIRKC